MKFLTLFLVFFSFEASAQLDPAASRLLGEGSVDQSLDSSRYQVKPRSNNKVEKPVQRVAPTPVPKPTLAPDPTPKPVKKKKAKKPEPVEVKVVEDDSHEETRIHYQDPRLNIVQIKFAPGFLYIDSKSQSWYRDYHSFSPNVYLETDVWVTPTFGIRANYGTSLAADVSSSPTSTSKTATDHRYFGAGILFRHYASASRKAPSYTVGVGLDDYQLVLPKTETERIRMSTNGMSVSMAARIPVTVREASRFAVEFMPKLKTKEEATQVDFNSGSLDSAYGVKLTFGKEYVIDRKQQFYWQLSHRLEKHVYEGDSSANDPITGSTLSGLTVTKGTTQFQIGISWGD